jgi:hypothetical protein
MTLRDEILEIQRKAKASNDAERQKRTECAGKKIGEALKEIAQSNPDSKEFFLPIRKGVLTYDDDQLAVITDFSYLCKWMSDRGIEMEGRYDRSECNGQCVFRLKDDLPVRGSCE